MAGDPNLWSVIGIMLVALYSFLRLTGRKNEFLKRFLVVFVPALLLAFGITAFLKMAVAMPRPCTPCVGEAVNCNPYCPIDYGFPSGHAVTIFTVFTSLYLAARHKRRMLILPYIAIPFAVALSRVLLGVHTVLDVSIGMLMGIILPYFFWRYHDPLKSHFKVLYRPGKR